MTDHDFPEGHPDDEILSALAGSDAPEPERAAWAAHLGRCGRCAGRLAELAAVTELVAAPVRPLADDVKDAQLRRAMAALTAEDEAVSSVATPSGPPPARPLPSKRRRHRVGQAVLQTAAAVVVVVLLGFGAVKLLPHGASSPSSGSLGQPHASPSTSPPIDAQLRPVTGVGTSCSSFDTQDEGPQGSAPYVVVVPKHHDECVTLGAPIAFFDDTTTGSISGPGGLRGSDTVTLHSDAPRTQWPTGTPPVGPQLVLVADGAAVGIVHSITVVAGTKDATIVATGVPPAVAEYLQTLFGPA